MPIIETQANDVAAYIPTNVISITDGQIYLEPDLFNAGIRPALNVGISVSRVGSAAQTKIMKAVAGRLKLDHALFRELQAFAQFGTSDLDAVTRRQLERGLRANEVLKQGQFVPMSLAEEVAILFGLTEGLIDDVEVEKIQSFEAALCSYLQSNKPEVLSIIEEQKELTDETREALNTAIKEVKENIPY